MYCGNNIHNQDLLNGTKVLGTRYSCLLKGKNMGLAQPVDPNFLLPYAPIDNTRKYCGNNNALPAGYDRFGGLYECYLKGLGVGKRLKATGANPAPPSSPPSPPSPPSSPSMILSSLSSLSSLQSGQSQLSQSSQPFQPSQSSQSSQSSQPSPLSSLYNLSHSSPPSSLEDNFYLKHKTHIGIVIYILLISIFFVGMYYGKPSIIIDKTDKENKIDWEKFIMYIINFCIILGIIIYFLFK